MQNPEFFVHVQSTYSAKNKLCSQIIDALQVFDCTLFLNEEIARTKIKKRVEEIIESYKNGGGKAKPPEYFIYGNLYFMVSDTILLAGHTVKNHLTE